MDDITTLPDELLLQIFSKLGFNGILACFTVCKDWHIIISDLKIWENALINDGLIRKEFCLSKLYPEISDWIQLGRVMNDNLLTNVNFEHETDGWEVAGKWKRELLSGIRYKEGVDPEGEEPSPCDHAYYLDTMEESQVKKETWLGAAINRVWSKPTIEGGDNPGMIKRSQKVNLSRVPKLQELFGIFADISMIWSVWVWPYNGRYQSILVAMSGGGHWSTTTYLGACAKPDHMWSYEANDNVGSENKIRSFLKYDKLELDYVYHEFVRKNVRICNPVLQLRFGDILLDHGDS